MIVKQMFKEGIKPAWLVHYKKRNKDGVKDELTPIFKELSQEFPYIIFEHRNNVLFFNDELHKEWFEANGCVCGYSSSLGKWIQDYKHDVLGYALGYPPSAVESWRNKLGKGKRQAGDRVGINYYGIQFVCEPHDVENCIQWLREFRPIPTHMQMGNVIYIDNKKRELV